MSLAGIPPTAGFFGKLYVFSAAIDSGLYWLSDIGVGLRFLNARASFGNILHVDLAFPMNRDPSIKSFQVLVQTGKTF